MDRFKFIKEMMIAETIIYLDLTLIVNMLMNVLLLLLVSRLSRRKVYPLWLAMGTFIASIPLMLWILGIPWHGLSMAGLLLCLPVTVFVGLRIRRLEDLIQCLVIFIVLAALSGGGVYMVTGSGTRLTLETLWIIPALMSVMFGIVVLWQRWHKTDAYLQQVLYTIELEFGWGGVELSALLDTGNELKDPITASPVIIAEERVLKPVLPPAVQRFLDSPWQKERNPWILVCQSPELAHMISFIATESVGGRRLLPAIRAQSLVVKTSDKASAGSVRIIEPKVSVLLVNQVLSAENRFQALLHPQCVNLSGRNIGDVVQENTCASLGKAQDPMHRHMA